MVDSALLLFDSATLLFDSPFPHPLCLILHQPCLIDPTTRLFKAITRFLCGVTSPRYVSLTGSPLEKDSFFPGYRPSENDGETIPSLLLLLARSAFFYILHFFGFDRDACVGVRAPFFLLLLHPYSATFLFCDMVLVALL